MQIVIKRDYHTKGTNGVLTIYGEGPPLCYTIELPWRNNEPKLSCIPAGVYTVTKRYSQKFKWHLHLQDVPGRSYILIHPANNAEIELQGCIAPVTILTSPGTGLASKPAFQKLMARVTDALQRNETIFLTITPKPPAEGLNKIPK